VVSQWYGDTLSLQLVARFLTSMASIISTVAKDHLVVYS
jgi:hypothetical protein